MSRDGIDAVAVANPAQALGLLARAAFGTETRVPRVVGVTGTNGKTTTAHLVEYLLAHNGLRTGLSARSAAPGMGTRSRPP